MIFYCKKSGFTLIELMVSVSIFVIVMTISMGAIISILDANSKSETERSVVDNLNSTLESMTRTIRFGTNYHASAQTTGSCNLATPRDTQVNDGVADMSSMSVIDSDGNEVSYSLVNGQIMRSVNNASPFALTSPDVNIQTLSFRVFGSYPYVDPGNGCGSDSIQPIVIIVMKGVVTGQRESGTTFSLETTVSQRTLDSL